MLTAAVGLVSALVLAQATPPSKATTAGSSPRVWKAVPFAPPDPKLSEDVGPRPCLKMRIIKGNRNHDSKMPILHSSSAVDPNFNIGDDTPICDSKLVWQPSPD